MAARGGQGYAFQHLQLPIGLVQIVDLDDGRVCRSVAHGDAYVAHDGDDDGGDDGGYDDDDDTAAEGEDGSHDGGGIGCDWRSTPL